MAASLPTADMKITVIGCGRWGSFIAWYLDSIGHNLTVYDKADSPAMKELMATRTNGVLTYPDSIKLTADLSEALASDIIVISIPSQVLRSLMGEIVPFKPRNKTLILCMKGIEISTGRRLSEITSEFMCAHEADNNHVAVWIGPGHPQEFARGVPNCMVIDSAHQPTKEMLVDNFSSPLIRFYYGSDLIGNEIGAAAKNVIGIAAGMLDGKGVSSLKGALMSRATREVARLIEAMGGDMRSAYGLCHLGDYEATVFSKFSHNRAFGEAYIKGEKFEKLAEGYYTAAAIENLCRKYGVEMPICQGIYKILYENASPDDVLESLFSRSLKNEF
ncbi:MAG: NAD(P)H-dependent glycerol-3-phosphate dehydrogenase [Eubacteriales bacterium]